MSILDKKKLLKTYGLLTLFCILFSVIYELFSHNVYSKYMIYAPLIPLIFGIIFFIFHKYFNKKSYAFYNSLCILLIIYSYIMGVLEIYGTTNKLVNGYIVLIIINILLLLKVFIFEKK